MPSSGLALAHHHQRRPPVGAKQCQFLDHLEVDIDVVTQPNTAQQLVGLLEEVHRSQRHGDPCAGRDVAVAAGLGVGHQPGSLSQGIHRPVHLLDLSRGLCQESQRLGSPHQVGLVIKTVKQVQSHRHGLVM